VNSFLSAEFLPDPSGFERLLDAIAEYARTARSIAPNRILESFFGYPVRAGDCHVQALDHVALYAGDYRSDCDFDAWLEYLTSRGSILGIESGPSYIAPREYGTQGYWISGTVDGAGIEIFSNKHAGPWTSFQVARRALRMSHFAFLSQGPPSVLELLEALSRQHHVGILAYSAHDQLGHTYGHLLNKRTDRVLEILHRDLAITPNLRPDPSEFVFPMTGIYGWN
jgi:excinuclease ABC subunit A